MPACERCRVVQATAEVRRVRADSKELPAGSYVCKDTVACRRRRELPVDLEGLVRSAQRRGIRRGRS